MKQIRTTTAVVAMLAALTFTAMAEEKAQPGLVAAIIDDQTGEELATEHGIQPLVLGDLEALIKGVLQRGKPASLIHIAVDDDAADNPVGRLTFAPYAGGKPPKAPSPSLPLRVLTAESAKYKQARAQWQTGIRAYQAKVVGEADGFVRQVAATQLKVSERFDKILEERNGRDFNRSDVVGCVTLANGMLGKQGRRVLILNTDAKDLPAKRAPRTTPLKAEEISPDVELIWVNTSKLPQQSVLFRGLPNKVHSVVSMKAAFALLVEMLVGDEEKGKPEDQQATSTEPDAR